MKKGLIMMTMTSMLLASVPAYGEIIQGPMPGMTIEITYENGRKIITTHCSPEFSASIQEKEKVEKPPFEPIPPLEKAPEVGSTLATILKNSDNLDVRTADSYMPAYATHSIGQCAWYADGRFMEVHGIRMPFGMGAAGEWLDNAYKSEEIKTITDLNEIPEQSIAVFKPSKDFDGWPGHVEFIEYVEYDSYGKPQSIYFTDANGTGDKNKGIYDIGYDGTVKKLSFKEFKNQYGLILVGYIVPNIQETTE